MDSTLPAPAERRSANRRVGAAALAAFLALLVLAAARGPAQASPTSTPQGFPGTGAQPQDNDDDGFRGRRDGRGGPGFGGGQAAPGAGSSGGQAMPDAGGGQTVPDDGTGGFGGQTAPDAGGDGGQAVPDAGGGQTVPDDGTGGFGGGQTTPAPSEPSTSGGTTT